MPRAKKKHAPKQTGSFFKRMQQKWFPFQGMGALLFGGMLLLVILLGFFVYYTKDLPRPEKFLELSFAQSTKIYDRTGKHLLYEVYGQERRELITLDQVPQHLKDAIIATEDANFYSHHGIDLKALGRSLLVNLKSLSPAQGGSTLTQQLVRSSFLSHNKTIERKIKEIVLTLELERRYPKDQIFEFYLNQVPMSANAYGVKEAARLIFSKDVSALSLEESAVLAALIKGPSYYSPFGPNQEALMNRKNYVLGRMADNGFISKEEAKAAEKKELVFADPVQNIVAPHFTLEVIAQLAERYGEDAIREGGLRVKTTIDWDLQQKAEKTVAEFAKRNVAYNAYNASLVAINPKTGEILAMVGSKDWFAKSEPEGCMAGANCFFDPKLNIATADPGRQPGSAFKPFVYATAFVNGYDDNTIVMDEPTNFGTWGGKTYAPQNYDGLFRGPVTLRQSLAQSLNVPSVKVLADLAGLEESIGTAQSMGLTTLNRGPAFYGLALVLGGGEVKLLDMVSAYGVFANEGRRAPAFGILDVQDAAGNVLESHQNTTVAVLSKEVASLVTSILSDNDARSAVFGARSPLYFSHAQVAVKTGTTQDFKDGWIIGYTPDIVSGVWVGNNNGELMKKEPGVVVAGPMWHTFMEFAIPYLKTTKTEQAKAPSLYILKGMMMY